MNFSRFDPKQKEKDKMDGKEYTGKRRWRRVSQEFAQEELGLTHEVVERLAQIKSSRGSYTRSIDDAEMAEDLLKLRDSEAGDFVVWQVNTDDIEQEGLDPEEFDQIVDKRVANMRSKIAAFIKEQDWPYRVSGAGRKTNFRAYNTIPVERNGKPFIVVQRTQSIRVDEQSE